ncbi:MAG: hypothetical protein AB8F26_07405 [Phycisphaerales bacterium]
MNHFFIALLVVLTTAGLASAQDQASRPPEIDPELAARRIKQILSIQPPTQYEIESLIDIADRCKDPEIAALASFNAGTMMLDSNPTNAVIRLRDADRKSSDPNLQSAARFNLAHALVNAIENSEEQETLPNQPTLEQIDEQIVQYTRAAETFRSTLETDPASIEAARNTERIRRKIRELLRLREMIQEQQQAMQELAEQLEELADQQQQQSDQSQQQSNQNRSPTESDQAEQQQTSEETEQARQQSVQSNAPQETDEALERARQAQQRAEEALQAGDAEQAAQEQQAAADALREAAEQARKASEQSDTQEGDESDSKQQQPQPNESDQESEGQSDQPALDPFAEALIDNEREQRARRMRYLQSSGRQRVERDW